MTPIASFFLAIAFLLLALRFAKQRFPGVLNPLQRWSIWALKAAGRILWQPAERRGGAKVQPPRFRYRR